MQLNPRLLVNLLVKLTKNEYPNGGHGGGSPPAQFQLPVGVRGIHSGEARTSDQHQIVQQWLGGPLPRKPSSYLLAPTSLSPLYRSLPIFTDFHRFFTDLSDFLGKTIGNIGNIS